MVLTTQAQVPASVSTDSSAVDPGDATTLDFYALPTTNETATAASGASTWVMGLNLIPAIERQQFADGTHSTLDTLTLRPSIDWQHWEIALIAPYQRLLDASYFNQLGPAGPRSVCNHINQLSTSQFSSYVKQGIISRQSLNYCQSHHFLKSFQAVTTYSLTSGYCHNLNQLPLTQLNQLLRSGRLNKALMNFCKITYISRQGNSSQEATGWNDLGLELLRNFGKNNAVWSGSVGLLAKDDNGNVNSGLGTGTRTLSFEYSLSGHWHFLQTTWAGGYTYVAANPDNYSSFNYTSLDACFFPDQPLHPGLSYNYQPASLSSLSDTQYFSAYLEWQPVAHFQLHLYTNRYLHPNSYFPQQDFGAYLNISI